MNARPGGSRSPTYQSVPRTYSWGIRMSAEEVSLTDLAIDEIRELLGDEGEQLSLEQIQVLARFVVSTGGLENALATLEELSRSRQAA
jgi:hypothetical protein